MRTLPIILILIVFGLIAEGQNMGSKKHKKHQRIYSEVGGFLGRYYVGFPNGLASARYDGKYGFIDTNGTEKIKCQYNYVSEFKFGKAMVARGEGFYNEGMIDTTGKEIIPCKYRFVTGHRACFGVTTPDLNEDFIVEQNGKYGKIYNNGTVAFPCIYSNEIKFNNGYATVDTNGKYGIINEHGKVIIPLKYARNSNTFNEGLIGLGKKNDSNKYVYGFLDTLDQLVIPFNYDAVEYFSEGLAAVRKNKLWGYINRKGEIVIDYQYDDTRGFKNGYACVRHNKKWGLIDKQGALKLPYNYDDSYGIVVDGLIPERDSNQRFGVVDTNNHVIVPFKYDWVESFSDNRAAVRINEFEGYINEKGEEIIPCQFKWAHSFINGIANVWRVNREDPERIDTNGNFIDKKNYGHEHMDVSQFINGIALVENYDEKWGFIDKTGKNIIACQFDEAGHFSEGLAPVRNGKNWFFIRKDGNIAIRDSFEDVKTLFNNGSAIVEKNEKYGMIDTTGKVVVSFKFDYLGEFNEGFAPAQIGEQYGYINATGEFAFKSRDKTYPFCEGIGAINDSLNTYFINRIGKILFRLKGDHLREYFSEGLALTDENDKLRYIDKHGKTVIKPIRCVQAYNFISSLAISGKKGKNSPGLGTINKRGDWIIPPIYASLSNFNKAGIASAKLNGRIGFINKKNQVVIPFIYEQCKGISDDKAPWIPVMRNGEWEYIDKHGRKVLGLK